MCGIVGYLGDKDNTVSVIFDGLSRLEYRGYDSSGIVVIDSNRSYICRCEGKLENLRNKLGAEEHVSGTVGIGHTRWATHGKPYERNAHPQSSGSVSVVHNGIIENYIDIKKELINKGYEFSSDTDTEVLAHLVDFYSGSGFSLEDSVAEALKKIEGTYAIAVVSDKEPDKIVAAKKFSPLIIASNNGEKFISSDVPAILPYTKDMFFLEDGDIAVLTRNGIRIRDIEGKELKRDMKHIEWDPVMTEKAGYRHYMLKEIYEQPRAALDTLRGKFLQDETKVFFENIDDSLFESTRRIYILGCGTSFHASMIGKYMIERISRINTQIELASEFRYREPVIDDKTVVIGISQSGETADTSEALLEAKRKGARTIGITNVEMSKIARESDGVIYTRAGPEIGVASTKAFSTQIITLYMLSVYLGALRNVLKPAEVREFVSKSISVTKLQQVALSLDDYIKDIAREFYSYRNFIFLGRGINYPVALEGALKLKEISYIHAEGYAAGEMKHGPIALIDENMPVVFIAPEDDIYYRKLLGNFQEIKARGGRIIFITSESNSVEMLDEHDVVIRIPGCDNILSPLLTVIPVQFLAYHIANLLGTDIDQPRNLAKVVTVE